MRIPRECAENKGFQRIWSLAGSPLFVCGEDWTADKVDSICPPPRKFEPPHASAFEPSQGKIFLVKRNN